MADPAGGLVRCLHLLPDTDDAGAENQARYLLAALAEHPHFEPELAFFGEGRGHEAFEQLGIPMHQVQRKRRLRTDLFGRARRLRSAWANREPEILHTWLLEGNIIGLLAARTWSATRVVITQRGSWNELDYGGLVRIQRRLIDRADAAISNSGGGAEMLAQDGMRPERVTVVANGIPAERVSGGADRIATRRRLGWEEAEVVAWVGRIDDLKTAAQKDLVTLYTAVGQLRAKRPSVSLALIGPSDEELDSAGVPPPPWAQALGWHSQPGELLRAADLMALSSKTEGNSNVVGEALVAGTPVVSTDCGGHCEAVRASGGRVVAVADPGAMAKAMEELLEHPPERGSVTAAGVRALSVDRMVAETVAVYERALATGRDN